MVAALRLIHKGVARPIATESGRVICSPGGGGPAKPNGVAITRKGAYIVEITPQDVQKKTFERAKRGYDPQQVGMFLDQVAASLASRDRELHEARTEIEALNRAVVDVKQNEEAFRLTMNAAVEAKEEMLRRAQEEADRLEDEARQGAEVIIERARVEADSQIAGIKHEVESLEAEKAALELQVADLRGTAETVRNSLDAMDVSAEALNGRPALELVVDQDSPAAAGEAGLAARVGDLRG